MGSLKEKITAKQEEIAQERKEQVEKISTHCVKDRWSSRRARC